MLKSNILPMIMIVIALLIQSSARADVVEEKHPGGTSESGARIGMGVHVGSNFSNLKIERTGSATIGTAKENQAGVLLGLHLELGTEMFMIRPEINYSSRGYKFANIVEVNQRILEIPVLVRVNFFPGLLKPFAEVGPQFGFHMSDNVTTLGTTTSFASDTKTLDISGVAGAGLRLTVLPNLSIEGEGRYVFGFTDQNSSDDIEVKTRGFQLLVGLTMRY